MKKLATASLWMLWAAQPTVAQVREDPTVSAAEVARMMSGRAIVSSDEDEPAGSGNKPRHVFTPNAYWYPRYTDNELEWRKEDAREKMLELANQNSGSAEDYLFWVRHAHHLFAAIQAERAMCRSVVEEHLGSDYAVQYGPIADE